MLDVLESIAQEPLLWAHLTQTTKPIVLYGMGNGADQILDLCQELSIPVAGIFASDEFVRGQEFRGFTVKKYAEIQKELGDFIILIAFASERPEILERFFHLAQLHETYAPHLPLLDEVKLVDEQWIRLYHRELAAVYENLADDLSRQVFQDILRYKLTGSLKYLQNVTQRREDLTTLLPLGPEESYLDLGAYNGDTLTEFLELTNHHYQHIYAVEPDPKNFRKLRHYVEEEQLRNCSLFQKGIWRREGEHSFQAKGGRMSALVSYGTDEVPLTTIDAISDGKPITYIKMDVEGAEKEALEGGAATIARCQPQLLLAGYHYEMDLFALPLKLWELVPEYKIYLRRHPYVPCWEINFFVTK